MSTKKPIRQSRHLLNSIKRVSKSLDTLLQSANTLEVYRTKIAKSQQDCNPYLEKHLDQIGAAPSQNAPTNRDDVEAPSYQTYSRIIREIRIWVKQTKKYNRKLDQLKNRLLKLESSSHALAEKVIVALQNDQDAADTQVMGGAQVSGTKAAPRPISIEKSWMNLKKRAVEVERKLSKMSEITNDTKLANGCRSFEEVGQQLVDFSQQVATIRRRQLSEFLNNNKNFILGAFPGYVILLGMTHLWAIFWDTPVKIFAYTTLEDYLLVGADMIIIIGALFAAALYGATSYVLQSATVAYITRRKEASCFQAKENSRNNSMQRKGSIPATLPIAIDRGLRRIGIWNWRLLILVFPFVFAFAWGQSKYESSLGNEPPDFAASMFIKLGIAHEDRPNRHEVTVITTVSGSPEALYERTIVAGLSSYVFLSTKDGDIDVIRRDLIECISTHPNSASSNSTCIPLTNKEDAQDLTPRNVSTQASVETSRESWELLLAIMSISADSVVNRLKASQEAAEARSMLALNFENKIADVATNQARAKLDKLLGDFKRDMQVTNKGQVRKLKEISVSIDTSLNSPNAKILKNIGEQLKLSNDRDREYNERIFEAIKELCEQNSFEKFFTSLRSFARLPTNMPCEDSIKYLMKKEG